MLRLANCCTDTDVSALLEFLSESHLHSMNKLMTYVIRNNMCWVMQQVVSEMTSMTVWQLFSMDVYNPESRQPLPSDELYQQLLHIVSQSPSDVTVPIGLLTSQHRDTWFKDFTQLSQGLMLLSAWGVTCIYKIALLGLGAKLLRPSEPILLGAENLAYSRFCMRPPDCCMLWSFLYPTLHSKNNNNNNQVYFVLQAANKTASTVC